MKKFLLSLLFIAVASVSGISQGINWEQGTFQEALQKAKTTGVDKLFVDCYTSWCGPCKHMAKVVFPTKAAGDYFNANFVNVKMDMEKGEGVELAKKYKVAAYPTFLVLDSNGNELGRVVGSADVDGIIAKVKAVLVNPIKKVEGAGIKWEECTLLEAVNIAAKGENGINKVFLDCYTSWCGPCKYMAENEFPKKEAGDYFNANFVNVKMDMEKGEGPDIAKKYGIVAFPTFLILDGTGKEIGRVIGGGDINDFIEKIKVASDPANSPETLKKEFEQTYKMSAAYGYMENLYKNFKDKELGDFIISYFDKFDENEIYSEKFWKYAKSAILLSDVKFVRHLLGNKWIYDGQIGKGKVDKDLYDAIYQQLLMYLFAQQQLPAENVEMACDILTMYSKETPMERYLIEVSKAKLAGDTEKVIQMSDGRGVGYSYDYNEIYQITNILLKMESIPVESKKEYIKGVKAFLQNWIEELDKQDSEL